MPARQRPQEPLGGSAACSRQLHRLKRGPKAAAAGALGDPAAAHGVASTGAAEELLGP